MMGGWFSQPPIYKAVPNGIFEKGLSLHDHNVRRMNHWVAAIKVDDPSTVDRTREDGTDDEKLRNAF